MKCVQCGSDVAQGAIACPECGARLPLTVTPAAGAPVPQAEALTAPPAAPAPTAFRLDPAKWTPADRVTGAATLVLVISLFLPWFSVSAGFGNFTASSSADALAAHGFLYLVLLLALAMLGYLIARASLKDLPELPVTSDQLLAAGAAVNLLLVLIAFAVRPGGGSALVKVSWSFGAFIGLIAAIVSFVPMATSVIRARSGRAA
jgi:hypothetical protein